MNEHNKSAGDQVKAKVLAICNRVYDHLGPGHTEQTYQKALAEELKAHGATVRCEVMMPVLYTTSAGKEIEVGTGRADICANFNKTKVLLELKAGGKISDQCEAVQILRYIQSLACRGNRPALAMVINFPKYMTIVSDGVEHWSAPSEYSVQMLKDSRRGRYPNT